MTEFTNLSDVQTQAKAMTVEDLGFPENIPEVVESDEDCARFLDLAVDHTLAQVRIEAVGSLAHSLVDPDAKTDTSWSYFTEARKQLLLMKSVATVFAEPTASARRLHALTYFMGQLKDEKTSAEDAAMLDGFIEAELGEDGFETLLRIDLQPGTKDRFSQKYDGLMKSVKQLGKERPHAVDPFHKRRRDVRSLSHVYRLAAYEAGPLSDEFVTFAALWFAQNRFGEAHNAALRDQAETVEVEAHLRQFMLDFRQAHKVAV